MRLSDFDFALPRELIAAHPARPRDASRLLVVPATGAFEDRAVRDLPALLRPGDLLVLNDTRVIPARLRGKRGGVDVEVLVVLPLQGEFPEPARATAFAKPGNRLRIGDRIEFAWHLAAFVEAKNDDGTVALRFNMERGDVHWAMLNIGEPPLPPYIHRPSGPLPSDREDYQTVYARTGESIAAPTAGLHFTPELFAALEARGVARTFVTLHVGAGTFLPVKTEDVSKHVMHAEWGEVSSASADAIGTARARGGRIVAVGTTSLRLLESAADTVGAVRAWSGETRLFITPGYTARTADMLLTNFHLPRSTLFMLVSAFAGLERMKAAYAHAVAKRYRFFSYGDACLLERAAP
jgi:S-adenosylmethionine:tRNA ribosyltransferase-isomerase